MSDVVVAVPMGLWEDWIAEGDLPGDDPADSPLDPGDHWGFTVPRMNYRDKGATFDAQPGDRCYIIAHGKLRGWSPITAIEHHGRSVEIGRRGGAVACTIDEPIRGFRGWARRWWDRADEVPFADWKTP